MGGVFWVRMVGGGFVKGLSFDPVIPTRLYESQLNELKTIKKGFNAGDRLGIGWVRGGMYYKFGRTCRGYPGGGGQPHEKTSSLALNQTPF